MCYWKDFHWEVLKKCISLWQPVWPQMLHQITLWKIQTALRPLIQCIAANNFNVLQYNKKCIEGKQSLGYWSSRPLAFTGQGRVYYYVFVCLCVYPSVFLCSKCLKNIEPINFIFDERLPSDPLRKPFDFYLPGTKADLENSKCWPNDNSAFSEWLQQLNGER